MPKELVDAIVHVENPMPARSLQRLPRQSLYSVVKPKYTPKRLLLFHSCFNLRIEATWAADQKIVKLRSLAQPGRRPSSWRIVSLKGLGLGLMGGSSRTVLVARVGLAMFGQL